MHLSAGVCLRKGLHCLNRSRIVQKVCSKRCQSTNQKVEMKFSLICYRGYTNHLFEPFNFRHHANNLECNFHFSIPRRSTSKVNKKTFTIKIYKLYIYFLVISTTKIATKITLTLLKAYSPRIYFHRPLEKGAATLTSKNFSKKNNPAGRTR